MRSTLLFLIAVTACGPAAPTTTEGLVGAMRDRYDGVWPRTVSFVQDNTNHLPDGTIDRSTIDEAFLSPGGLRIEQHPVEEKSGILMVNDSQYDFRNDSMVAKAAGGHPLLLLAADVYFYPPEETLRRLEEFGFDTGVFREDSWEGREAYVVGAAQGDLRAGQFWIDKERLVVIRVVRPTGPNGERISEVQFRRIEPLGDGWIAPEVVFLTDGERTLLEEYRDIRFGEEFDPGLFDPAAWSETLIRGQ